MTSISQNAIDFAALILRLALFFISMAGYGLLTKETLKINTRFMWIFIAASITCVIYFAGLLGVLSYAAYIVFSIGFVLVIVYAIRKQLGILINVRALNVLNICFTIGAAIVFSSLYNTKYMHYDNFSHWGLIIKYMLITDSFPTYASAIIDFKTYPLGSSTFVYYFCKIVGSSQGAMLLGQTAIIFACFYAMFGIISDSRRMLLLGTMASFCIIMAHFNISIRINNLLVDFLLPLLALSSIAAIFRYRHDLKKASIVIAPILAMLVIVKNSGVIFAVFCYVYLLNVALRRNKYQPGTNRAVRIATALFSIIASLLTLAAWKVHSAVALSGVLSKHTMSVDNFNQVYGEKTPEIIYAITENFIKTVSNPLNLATSGIILCNIIAVVSYLIARIFLKRKWSTLKIIVITDVAVALYYSGILAMFLLTMPVDEAIVLAGLERYSSSMVIFVIGVLAIFLVHDIELSFQVRPGEQRDNTSFKSLLSKSLYEYASIILVSASSILLLSEVNGMNSMKLEYPDSLPARVEAFVGDNWSGIDNNRYLVYASDDYGQISNWFLQYVFKYFMFSAELEAINYADKVYFDEYLRKFDYLIVFETNRELEEFMGNYGYAGNLIGRYPVKECFG